MSFNFINIMRHSNRNYDMNKEIITKIQSFFSVYIVSIILCNGFPQMSQANDRLKKYGTLRSVDNFFLQSNTP